MALPRFVVLKSKYNNKYLRYINEEVQQVHGFVQFSGEEVVSPYVKFQVEWAKSGRKNGHLVHIRCCYSNKYLVIKWSPNNQGWIVAGADEPNEDQSIWSCTLFEPIYVQGTDGVRFRHVQLGRYVCLWRDPPPWYACLFSKSANIDKDGCDVYTIINWESLLILPKHVAFKGDNGKYLSAHMIERHPYLQFASSDIGDERVGNEVFTTSSGSIRIKSDFFGKFWRRSPNWIWPDSDDTTTASNNSDTLFWPVKVDDNIIALRNLGSNNFCKRLTTEGKTSCLNAAVRTITKEARLQLDETVLSRKIYNVDFRLMDARIYNKSFLTMANGDSICKRS
ncbi:hypothetical protein HYC85_020285 [Camellia sinensis]|uniref:Agglutinin domain-containing protein n=1 Tax=Camellia sinensis TaxID=4442 RepID=A0A7J7GPC1_CAMSI|nr:hypothetical protein HYC85_020285 [Camellia sinensis]